MQGWHIVPVSPAEAQPNERPDERAEPAKGAPVHSILEGGTFKALPYIAESVQLCHRRVTYGVTRPAMAFQHGYLLALTI